MKKFLFLVAIFAFLPMITQNAWAWGPITHLTINSEAARITGQDDADESLMMAGHTPDMISFYHVVSTIIPIANVKPDRFDYGHNLVNTTDRYSLLDVDEDSNEDGVALFGKKLLKAYRRAKHPRRFTIASKTFSYGWIGHQLADRYAHGTTGYVNTKKVFSNIPYYEKPVISRIGNHGATELILDAILLEKFADRLARIYVPSFPALVHEGAIRYHNDVRNSSDAHTISRKDLITCSVAKNLARNWSIYLGAYQKLVRGAVSRPWFPEAKEYYSDYIVKYNRSVEEVAAFLENPTYEVAASQKYPFSQRFASVFSGLFDRFRSLFRSEKVQAEEGQESEQLPESLYYTFVNDVAQEAETLGALQTQETMTVADPGVTGSKSYEFSTEVVNEEAFQQALTTVINRDLSEANPLETRLWAKFMEGLYLRDDLSFKEITTRAQDFTPPAIISLTPEDGSFINNPRPAIYALVEDDPLGIELDLGSLKMRVDGVLVDHSYVEEMDMVLYTLTDPLPDGEHSVSLAVSDRAGNSATSTWSFTVDTVPPQVLHQLQNKIINIKKGSKAEIKVSDDEDHVGYLLKVFRIKETLLETTEDSSEKISKGEKVFTGELGEDVSGVEWDGMDNNGQLVPNGVYTLRIAATDRAGNESSFEEQVNVNNEAGEEPDAD